MFTHLSHIPMPSLITQLVDGQSQLAQLNAEEQDRVRWELLDNLCGPVGQRLRPDGFKASDTSKRAQLNVWREELVKCSVEDAKAHLMQPRDPGMPRILFTITTCKRLQLFLRTMHSFIRHCLDCWRITEWIALDDGSTDEELSEMRTTFPFLRVLSKSALGFPKGHAVSLNQLWWGGAVNGGYDYVFQMEDDWQFIRPDLYITRCIQGNHDQVLINRAYGETVFCLDSVGGHWNADLGVWEHDHRNPEPRAKQIMEEQQHIPYEQRSHGSHTYWPGFSLRPGLIKVSSFKEYQPFQTDGNHFEYEFAKRWKGTTAYLPEISSWHIGRLTSERHDDVHTLNAYELNKVDQFKSGEAVQSVPTNTQSVSGQEVAAPAIEQGVAIPAPANSITGQITHRAMHQTFYKLGADRISLDEYEVHSSRTREKGITKLSLSFEVWVINLDRRQDRLKKFCDRNGWPLRGLEVGRLSATDGKEQVANHHWDRLASYGDFHHHRGMMACAMSHIRLWQHLVDHQSIEWMVVMEDDAVAAPNFREQMQQHVMRCLNDHHADTWHLVWLGHHPTPHSRLFGMDWGKDGISSTLRGQVESSMDLMPASTVVLERWDLRITCRNSMGGTHGYMIHKRGAEAMLNHIRTNGMRNGIDWEMWHCPHTYACSPPLVHAPSPAVHSLLPECSDTDIQITKMDAHVSVFDSRLIARGEVGVSLRERWHLNALVRMVNSDMPDPSIVHVPVSRWHAQHPAILSEWAANESWLWRAHDLVWFQLDDSRVDPNTVNVKVDHPQRDQPLLAALIKVAQTELEDDVDFLCLSNRSVLVVRSSELFDAESVNAYFCMGAQQLDREWVKAQAV